MQGELTGKGHFAGTRRWKEMSDRGIKVGSGDEWIRLGALKGHIDGIMGTSSARFFQPYSNDPNNRGRWRPLMVNDKGDFVEGKFLGYMLDADRAGLQLTVHAIGDEANSVLLNYLEELDRRNGNAIAASYGAGPVLGRRISRVSVSENSRRGATVPLSEDSVGWKKYRSERSKGAMPSEH